MSTGIYTITSPTGSVYIGQTTCTWKRWYAHKNRTDRDTSNLMISLKEHGADNHKFELIRKLPKGVSTDILIQLEEAYILWYKYQGIELLNMTIAGKVSDQTKKLWSDRRRGKKQVRKKGYKMGPRSAEWKFKISLANKKRFELLRQSA